MKTVKNVTTTIEGRNGEKMKHSDLALECLNVLPQGGLDVSEMEIRLKVSEKLKASESEIELEDAEASKLVECVKAMKWALMHEDVVAFCKNIDNLK
jgi:hypothetical protein